MVRSVIQAGGKGMHLYRNSAVPKALMPLDDTPILEILVRQLVHYGFRDLTITVGPLDHLIMAVFGDGSLLGARINYLREKEPRGTLGALSDLRDVTEPILVVNGDLLTDFNFRAFMDTHHAGRTDLSVGTFHKEVPLSLGVFKLDEHNNPIGFYEKPVLSFPCNAGIYAIKPKLLPLIPATGPFGFDDLMKSCLSWRIPVRVHPFDGLWLDIGRPEDYASASELFPKNRERLLRTRPSETLTRLPRDWSESLLAPGAKSREAIKGNLMETIRDK
jgi:NDP-mannose synthase